MKNTPVRVEKIATEWRGFLLVRDGTEIRPDCIWATRITVPFGTLFEFAGNDDPASLEKQLPRVEQMEASDPARGTRRTAIGVDGKLVAALFVTRAGELPDRDWLIGQLAAAAFSPAVLAGRAPGAKIGRGAIICACFEVGLRTIMSAIESEALADVGAIGKRLALAQIAAPAARRWPDPGRYPHSGDGRCCRVNSSYLVRSGWWGPDLAIRTF